MTASSEAAASPVWRRLWIYQAERFPLLKTTTLLAAFSAASINVSAVLAGRSLPGWPTYLGALAVLLILFFQMRAMDEVKDAEDDRRYRPERPIPRGLVTQRLIVGIAAGLAPVALAASGALSAKLIWMLALVWLWLALMTAEFGAPEWLKTRPMLYLVSHMLIMPLIDLFVTGAEWMVRDGSPPPGLGIFLGLSFANGCVLEIGRKLFAPENEREGVETYTALYGTIGAAWLWMACLAMAFALLVAVGFAVRTPLLIASIGTIAFAAAMIVGWKFMATPTPALQKAADTMAGAWVLVCYLAAGFLPLIARGA